MRRTVSVAAAITLLATLLAGGSLVTGSTTASAAGLACRSGMPLTLNGAGAGTVTGTTTNYENEPVDVTWRNPTIWGVTNFNWTSPRWSPSFTGNMAQFNTRTGDLILQLSRPVKNAYINFYSIGQPTMPFDLSFFDHSSGTSTTTAPFTIAGSPSGVSNVSSTGFRAAEGNVSVHFPGTYSAIRVSFSQPSGLQESWMGVTFGLCLGEDFGDLPDTGTGTGAGNYQTLSTDGGPSHGQRGATIGNGSDTETEARQNATATGDPSDEITPAGIGTRSTTYSLDVPITYVGPRTYCLAGFLDANGDGDFADAGERATVLTGITASGTQTLTWNGFTGPTSASQRIGVRVRLASTDDNPTFCSNPLPTGLLMDGEVEDALLTVITDTDLAVTKTGPTAVVAGEQATWNITVTNNGPIAATGVTLTDTLPSQFTVDNMSSPDATCTTATLTCSGATLAVGATLTITLTATARVDVADGTTVTNSATATADQGETNSANNTGTAPITINRRVDLAITKTAGPAATAGGNGSFTITVTNNGPSTAGTITVSDTLDARFTFRPAGSDPACSATGQAVTCTAPSLAPGASLSFALGVTVAPDVADGASIDNTATVTATETETNTSNNTSTATLQVRREADLAVVKSAVTPTVTAGTTGTWSIRVTNNGPSDATNVSLNDPVPASFQSTGLTARITTGASGTCTVTGRAVACNWPTLGAGATTTVEVNGTIDPAAAAGGIDNTATIDADETDPVDSNNSSTASMTVDRSASLNITKTGASATTTAGGRFTWTVNLTNNGPSTASNVTLSDPLPAGMSAVSTTSNRGTCSGTTTIDCSLGTLAVGESATIAITVDVASSIAAGTTLTNTATADADETTPVSARASVTVERAVNLTITKSANAPRAAAGTDATWTLRVTNNGPSDASGVIVTDTIPAGFTVTSSTGGTCTGTSTYSCTIGTLAAGAGATLTITGTIDSAHSPGTMRNTASVTAVEPETAADDNVSSATIDVFRRSDLSLLKSDTADPVRIGTNVGYTLRVTNNGPSAAANPVVVDTLPSPLAFDAGTSDAGCTAQGQVVTCTITGELAASASATVMIGTRVPSNATAATVTNTASATSDSEDPDGATDTEPTTLIEAAGLRATKSVDRTRLNAGEAVRWMITIDNDGPTDAREVRIRDVLPADVDLVNITPSAGTCTNTAGTLDCTLGTIPANGRASVAIDATTSPSYVPASLDSRTLVNTVAVSSTTTGTDPCGAGSCTVTSVVEPEASVSITKSLVTSPAVAGRPVTWNVRVTNAGPSTARDLVVTDILDNRLEFVAHVAGDAATSDQRCRAAGRTITCTLGDLGVTSTDLRIVTRLAADATGTITNTASVTNPVGPTCTPSCSSTAETAITVAADLELTGSDAVSLPLGGTGTATFVARNLGPSTITAGTLTFKVPAGLDLTSAPSGSGYTCAQPSTDSAGTTTVTCTVPSLAVGAALRLPFTIVASRVATLSITATAVLPSGMETNLTNNEAVVPITVRAGADGLAITKTGSVASDRTVNWRITVTNQGPEVVPAGATMQDTLPSGLVVADVQADPRFTCASSVGGSTVGCTANARLEVGGSWTIDLATVADPTLDGTEVRNTASITSLGITRSAVGTATLPSSTRVLAAVQRRAPLVEAVAPLLAYTGTSWSLLLSSGALACMALGLLALRRRRPRS